MGKNFYQDKKHPWLKGVIFEDLKADDLLQRAQALKAHETKPPAWVFDLDSTLFSLSHRNQNIFSEFLRQHPRPPLQWLKALPYLDTASHKYDIEETFRDIFSEWDSAIAPVWAKELWREFEPFWYARFFSNWIVGADERNSVPVVVSNRRRSCALGSDR